MTMAYSESSWLPAEPDRSKLFLGMAGNSPVQLDKSCLLKHVVALGASGSGKTWLCKGLIEEAIRLNIPAIVIDPQGDLASLGIAGDPDKMLDHGLPDWLPIEYFNKVDMKVWTPGSEWGLPLSLQPALCFDMYQRQEDKIRAIHGIAQEIAGLAGFNDEATVAGFSKIIQYADRYNLAIDNVTDILDFLKDPPALLVQELEPIFNKKDRNKVLKGLIIKMNGPRQLLMSGYPIDIDEMLGYSAGSAYELGRARLSIVSLQALDAEEKQIVVAALARQFYAWLLADPKSTPVAAFFLDECHSFIPSGMKKPLAKDPLLLLLRQARKYGGSIVLASQSPGDIDFYGLGQIGTKLIGRLPMNQDFYKISSWLGDRSNDVDFANLQKGEFVAVSPDELSSPVVFKSRYLASRHVTLPLEALEQFVTEKDRDMYR